MYPEIISERGEIRNNKELILPKNFNVCFDFPCIAWLRICGYILSYESSQLL